MQRNLRIVHCLRSPVGGIFRHVRDLVRAQSEAGHHCGLICDSSTGGAYEDAIIAATEPYLALSAWRTPMQRHIGLGDFGAAWRTFSLIRKLQPDVLHGHGAKGGLYARAFGSLLRTSGSRVVRIYSPHGGVLHYDSGRMSGKLLFAVERSLERLTDHLLFVSEFERRSYADKVRPPKTASTLSYNGIHDDEFEPVATLPGAADILYVGMMRDLKGPDLLLEAMVIAERRLGRSISAVMVGDGADQHRYRAFAAQAGLEVEFRPPMPAREAFALGRIIVVPSRAEAMPYIVIEALAAAKPMIATAVGGIPEIFGDASPMLVAPDAGAIADALVAGLTDEAALAARMPSPEALRQRFGAAAMAARVEGAYAGALALQN